MRAGTSSCRYRWLAISLATVAAGCQPGSSDAPKSGPPATIAHIAKEDDLNTIRLSPEAELRLGIELAAIEMRPLERVESYGGEVTLPTGASIIVSAPVGGTLQAPSAGGVPKAGALVERGQPIFMLLPLLSPERGVLTPAERIRFAEARNAVAQSQIDAEGAVQQAKVQVDAARIALERAQRLLREQAGTVRVVDEAQAQLTLAQKALEAAQARKRLVDNIKLDEDAGTLAPLVLQAPQNGMVRAEHAAAGEVVSTGAPLFEVMDFDPVWIRVPVYAGDLTQIAPQHPAEISGIAEKLQAAKRLARPVTAPPTAAPLASTVDLYYELDNPRGQLRPGERVTAKLWKDGQRETLAVPWSAVIQDIQGGNWVYESVAPQTFIRRRIEVRYVVGNWAALERGPPAGAKIVTVGAVELYGAEFGFAK
jgi:RND family efflux transporter MFP subunit